MSEKMERRLRTGVMCLMAIIVVLVVMSFNNSSQYTNNDHLVEQGQLPVYVVKPDPSTTQNPTQPVEGNANTATPENTEAPQGGYMVINRENYEALPYDDLLKLCEKKDVEQIKMTVTIYSSLSVSSSIVYDAADADGNYYSIVDASNSGIKFNSADVVVVYGKPKGLSKINNSSIPQIQVHLIEKVEE